MSKLYTTSFSTVYHYSAEISQVSALPTRRRYITCSPSFLRATEIKRTRTVCAHLPDIGESGTVLESPCKAFPFLCGSPQPIERRVAFGRPMLGSRLSVKYVGAKFVEQDECMDLFSAFANRDPRASSPLDGRPHTLARRTSPV